MECKCHLSYNKNGVFGTPDIEKCPLCKSAPALLAACEDFVFLEKTNMTKKQVRLRIEIAKAALSKAKEQ